MKKIKLLIASILLTAFTLQLSAQKKDKKDDKKEVGPQNVIKMNVSQLVFTNLSFQYERAFHKNLSGALGISFLIPRDIPSAIYSTTLDTQGFQFPKFNGWAITPEFRFYPGEKIEHQAPHGFYLAPYFRYARYSVYGDYNDIVTNSSGSGTHLDRYTMTASYYGFTAGLMIGSQWVLGKHFSIDWWILGFGAGAAKFSLEGVSQDPTLNLSASQQAQLNSDIRANVGDLGAYGNGAIDVTTTTNSAKVVVSGIPMRSLRGFGLTLGFVF